MGVVLRGAETFRLGYGVDVLKKMGFDYRHVSENEAKILAYN